MELRNGTVEKVAGHFRAQGSRAKKRVRRGKNRIFKFPGVKWSNEARFTAIKLVFSKKAHMGINDWLLKIGGPHILMKKSIPA